MSEIELHGDENKSKNETDEKKISKNLVWKSLKQTAIDRNLHFGWIVRLEKAIKI